MTKTYSVRVSREYRVEVSTIVDVAALTAADAVRFALTMADADQIPGLDYHHMGEVCATYAQTKNDKGEWVMAHDG